MSGNADEVGRIPRLVLMTTDAVGGVWQYSLHLAAALSQRGSEILLVTFGPKPSDEQREQARAIPGVYLVETDFALEWMPNPWEDVDRAGAWLLSLQKSFAADLIHLNGYAHGALPCDAPKIVVAHSCVYSWWRSVRGDAPGAEWEEYKLRVTRGLQGCDAVIAPSAYMASVMTAEYGIEPGKIKVIYNSSPCERSGRVLKQPFAIAAGRLWDPAKNLTLLHAIAPALDWKLYLAGSTAGAEVSNEDKHVVRYLGAVPHEELLDHLQAASLFVHPALYEPFGLAVLEAASAGCCLMLADIPSLRELWSGAAVFVNPREPEQWIFEGNNLIRDFELRESLAQAALRRAKRYQPNHMLKSYLAVYGALRQCGRKRRSGVAA